MISAVILTKNEEKNLKNCLEGLRWCDEVVVVDDNSCDETQRVAQKLGAKVFINPLNGDFASQRNFGLEKAKGEWIFFVDADERVDQNLAIEIKMAAEDPSFSGYFVKRKDFMFGRWLDWGEMRDIKFLRLARKGAGQWQRPVHEVWDIAGNVGELKHPLYHYPHPTIADFLADINFYTTLDAGEFYRSRTWVGAEEIILYPLGKFIRNYFLNLGLLDGMAGFLVSIMMSFHSFLTRAKLWLLYQRAKIILENQQLRNIE